MADVFISYAREDRPLAARLAHATGSGRAHGLVGSRDPAGQGLRRADCGRARGRQGRGRDLVADLASSRAGCATRRARAPGARCWCRSWSESASRLWASGRSTPSTSPAGMVASMPGSTRCDSRSITCARAHLFSTGRSPSRSSHAAGAPGLAGPALRPWRWPPSPPSWCCCPGWSSGATTPTGRGCPVLATAQPQRLSATAPTARRWWRCLPAPSAWALPGGTAIRSRTSGRGSRSWSSGPSRSAARK